MNYDETPYWELAPVPLARRIYDIPTTVGDATVEFVLGKIGEMDYHELKGRVLGLEGQDWELQMMEDELDGWDTRLETAAEAAVGA